MLADQAILRDDFARRILIMAKKAKAKFNIINELHEGLMKTTTVSRNGTVKLKRAELKALIETTFTTAAKRAVAGERVRFPVIGALVRKDVGAKKGGQKVTNPFTGEPMITKARAATKKPRWSFPKTLKETFSNKKNW
jgi:nucleoid DNA-binding protein